MLTVAAEAKVAVMRTGNWVSDVIQVSSRLRLTGEGPRLHLEPGQGWTSGPGHV